MKALSIGAFDGVHRGHQEILKALTSFEGESAVYCTSPSSPLVLTPQAERDALISDYAGPRCLVSNAPVSLDILNPSSTLLVIESTHPGLQPLKESGWTIRPVDPVMHKDAPITSERIMEMLEAGDAEEAEAMLGRPYTLHGTVVYGRQLGRTVGMPTVNLAVPKNKMLPRHGVYGTITIVDGQRFLGVTSIGPRPTVDNSSHVTIETFLIHFNRDLYGQSISLEIKNFIRPITKFESLEAVRKKVDEDVLITMNKGYIQEDGTR